MKAIICDIDGVLIENPDWNGDLETFYKNILDGVGNEWCIYLLKGLVLQGIKILFVTARNERCRRQTKMQLDFWFGCRYELFMRGEDDIREDYLVKQDYIDEIKRKYDVLFCIDDNPKNCEMFFKEFPTLHVLTNFS
jgi:hypothetical protein